MTGGTTITVFKHADFGDEPVYALGTGSKSREGVLGLWDNELVDFLYRLQVKLKISKLQIRGEHRRGGVIFRGHPRYRDNSWRDWAMFDWGGTPNRTEPGQIWCFVVIDSIQDPENSGFFYGNIEVENGTYAVIEASSPDKGRRENRQSDIFLPYTKDVLQTGTKYRAWKRLFILADVEAIVKPLVVVPNIGGKVGTEFLVVRPRSEWVTEFKLWLDEPNSLDVIGPHEPEPSHGPPPPPMGCA
jgi:hypothetical protein